jgi:hypothetical protein
MKVSLRRAKRVDFVRYLLYASAAAAIVAAILVSTFAIHRVPVGCEGLTSFQCDPRSWNNRVPLRIGIVAAGAVTAGSLVGISLYIGRAGER